MRVKGVRCPGCDSESVEYNGNYYCEYALDGLGRCDWIMEPDLPTGKRPTADLIISLTHLKVDGSRQDYIDEYTTELEKRGVRS